MMQEGIRAPQAFLPGIDQEAAVCSCQLCSNANSRGCSTVTAEIRCLEIGAE